MQQDAEIYAVTLDEDQHTFRKSFRIPTRGELRRKTLKPSPEASNRPVDNEECTYLCGNSLGLQPVLTRKYFDQYLETWATKGVLGHFTAIEDSNLVPWLNIDDDVQADMAALVGAKASEVAVMQTLTANLHFLMASFYRPTKDRYKIILEHKAFPSDHYAVESQLQFHGQPKEAMILIEPEEDILSTELILRTIDEHAADTALLLLPGIQFYTGQYFDIRQITAYAQSKGIIVGWDLAHAAGNVPVQLHDCNVDFAAWCTYKYLNCGPGSIGAIFVHERHSGRTPRLSGWWSSSKTSRFDMNNEMEALPGASGFQMSNPSAADLTAVRASLDIFKQTSIAALREKSVKLTAYLEKLLLSSSAAEYLQIITPQDPQQRGAQLSIKLRPGMLKPVMADLEHHGVIVDERKPDVIRVAPAPLYNTFQDVHRFVKVFEKACTGSEHDNNESIMVDSGSDSKGWSEIK